MKKNYNIPATEVVAYVGGATMQSTSPASNVPDPNKNPQDIPSGNG